MTVNQSRSAPAPPAGAPGPSKYQALQAPANAQYTLPAYPPTSSANPFRRPASDTFGFHSARATLAINTAADTAIRSDEGPTTPEHTQLYEETNRPLAHGENLFGIDPRRMHNLLAGYDARPTPSPDVAWPRMVPEGPIVRAKNWMKEDGGRKRGRRGRKGKGSAMQGAAGEVKGDEGAFEDDDEYYEDDEEDRERVAWIQEPSRPCLAGSRSGETVRVVRDGR